MGNEPAPKPAPEPPANPAPVTTPPTPEPPAPAPSAQPGEPDKGGNDDAAVKRIQAERDALKSQVTNLEQKLAEAKTAEDIEAAKAAAKAEAELLVLDKSIDVALVQAGCVNVKATKALIDTAKVKLNGDTIEGLDTAALIKEYPYLFQGTAKVSTSANPSGAPNKEAERDARNRKVMGLPDKE